MRGFYQVLDPALWSPVAGLHLATECRSRSTHRRFQGSMPTSHWTRLTRALPWRIRRTKLGRKSLGDMRRWSVIAIRSHDAMGMAKQYCPTRL